METLTKKINETNSSEEYIQSIKSLAKLLSSGLFDLKNIYIS